MRSLLAAPSIGLFLLGAIPRAAAQCPIQTFRSGLDPGAGTGGGAVDGNHGIVTDGANPPSVHFLEKGPAGWRETQAIEIGRVRFSMWCAVSIDGDRAIAGCPEAPSGAEESAGRAFVFDRVGDRWFPTELVSPTNGIFDCFGTSVAISGNVAVVGASHSAPDGFGDHLPRAHVFEFDGTSWNEVTQITTYGAAIDVDGDTIVLGNAYALPGHPAGRVYIHERVGGIWTWTGEIVVPTPPEGPVFGTSVSLQGDRLVVGASAPIGHAPGFVDVYLSVHGGWPRVQHIIPSSSALNDRFGSSVAQSGTTLLVGALYAAGGHGAVYRFEDDGSGFVERGAITREDGVYDSFGANVSVDGEDAFLCGGYTSLLYRLGFEQETAFCPTTPNSTGRAGSLVVQGCDSLSGQRLTLVASDLPPGVLARCIFGANASQVPYGDGYRCVGSPFFRLPGSETDRGGSLVTAVDFASPPASHLAAGRTWKFQVVHRDRVGSGLNLTNTLSIGITP